MSKQHSKMLPVTWELSGTVNFSNASSLSGSMVELDTSLLNTFPRHILVQ